jgi:hypothetical protein
MALVLAAPAGLSGTVENVFTATEAVFNLGSSPTMVQRTHGGFLSHGDAGYPNSSLDCPFQSISWKIPLKNKKSQTWRL